MKKRIMIDVNSIVPYYALGKLSGIGRTTIELIKAFDKIKDHNLDIYLYSQNLKGIGGKKLNTSFKTNHLYIPHREIFNEIISKTNIKKFLYKYDLLHIPHNYSKEYDVSNCVVTLHDALFMKIQEKAFNHELMRIKIPPYIKKCKGIITCSEASKKDIMETMGIEASKIDVIYWGVRTDIFYPKDKNEVAKFLSSSYKLNNPYFLSVSCNAERKRTDKLVDAYINSDLNNFKNDLVLVWNNPPSYILDKIKNSVYASRIHILNNISDDSLSSLYNGATALIFPSSYEGFGLPILESMACNTPVITSLNSSLGEIGGNAVIYLNEPVTDSLKQVLAQIENSEYDLDSLRRLGLERVANFSWKNTAKKTLEVYKKHLSL